MKILSEGDITSLKSMAMYWDEVSKRDNPNVVHNILAHELVTIFNYLEIRILWIIKDYIRLLEKEAKE